MEGKLKHLEFIQNSIARLSSNSFIIKGWTITLVAGLFALAAKDANSQYVLIMYVSTFLFWMLDAYYLSQERQYRCLYDHVAKLTTENVDFSMNARTFNKGRNTWLSSWFAQTMLIFYGTLSGLTLLIMFVFHKSV